MQLPIPGSWPIICACVFAVIFLIFIIVRSCIAAYNSTMRKKFHDTYGIEVNASIKVRKQPKGSRQNNHYELAFPHWQFPNKDKSRDKRRSSNSLVWEVCLLFVDDFKLSTERPEAIGWLVKNLRRKGVQIKQSDKERRQTAAARREIARFKNLNTAKDIYEALASDAYEFESFCARILQTQGYRQVKTTPRTGDGGWDIEFFDSSNRSGIAECKCYEPTHKVGRPALNKLKGANSIKKADRLLFFTTSSFSQKAMDFARYSGIELIDGPKLATWAKPLLKEIQASETDHRKYEWPTWDDFAPCFPPDCPPSREFFE